MRSNNSLAGMAIVTRLKVATTVLHAAGRPRKSFSGLRRLSRDDKNGTDHTIAIGNRLAQKSCQHSRLPVKFSIVAVRPDVAAG